MGLVSKYEEPDALWFGIGIHEALAQWYKPGLRRGVQPAAYFRQWCGDEMREIAANYNDRDSVWGEDAPKYEDALELGVAMLEGYIDEYGKDPDWDVIATEYPFEVNVTHEGETVAVFASVWDGVYRDRSDGLLYLMEHKTARQISTSYLALDDQAGAYWAVAGTFLRAKGVLRPDEEIAGITYNFLRKSMPDERLVNDEGLSLNKDGSVSKKQPTSRFLREVVERSPAEQQTQLLRMADEVRVMNAMRDGTIPVYKNTNRDCTFCQFFTMCTLHERGGESWKTVMKAEFVQQNPYADRRKPA